MEQQTAAIKNPLPGAKKSLPYITETSKFVGYFAMDWVGSLHEVILFWKLVDLNKVKFSGSPVITS